nr:MAG TPA: hypothetical protein [Caudoviricetes sp.]
MNELKLSISWRGKPQVIISKNGLVTGRMILKTQVRS